MQNLPNLLTVLRVALVPLFALAFAWPPPAGRIAAFALFALASLTDYFDGLLARRWNAQSDFGRMLDPIADKLLIAIALMLLVGASGLRAAVLIPALLILGREIVIAGLREFLAGKQVSLPVSAVAKVKTSVQMAAIAALILAPLWPGAAPYALGLLWLAAVLTIYTGTEYFLESLPHLRGTGEPA